jgi:hypothetical protein
MGEGAASFGLRPALLAESRAASVQRLGVTAHT